MEEPDYFIIECSRICAPLGITGIGIYDKIAVPEFRWVVLVVGVHLVCSENCVAGSENLCIGLYIRRGNFTDIYFNPGFVSGTDADSSPDIADSTTIGNHSTSTNT